MNLQDPTSVEEAEDGVKEVCELAVVIHNSTADFYKKFCLIFKEKNLWRSLFYVKLQIVVDNFTEKRLFTGNLLKLSQCSRRILIEMCELC